MERAGPAPVAPILRQHGHAAVAIDLPCEDDAAGWTEYADTVIRALGDRGDLIVVGHFLGGFTAPPSPRASPSSRSFWSRR